MCAFTDACLYTIINIGRANYFVYLTKSLFRFAIYFVRFLLRVNYEHGRRIIMYNLYTERCKRNATVYTLSEYRILFITQTILAIFCFFLCSNCFPTSLIYTSFNSFGNTDCVMHTIRHSLLSPSKSSDASSVFRYLT